MSLFLCRFLNCSDQDSLDDVFPKSYIPSHVSMFVHILIDSCTPLILVDIVAIGWKQEQPQERDRNILGNTQELSNEK